MSKNFNLYKNKFLAISLIAIFAFSIVMTFAPTALAQISSAWPIPRPTAAYVAANPTLVGVGQSMTLTAWVLPCPQGAVGAIGPNILFTRVSATFTRPDGTKDTFTPTDGTGTYAAGTLDPLGSMYFYYVPNMAGNWSVTFSMPAQNLTDNLGTVAFAACTSTPAYFTVQTAAVNAGLLNGWPWSPLPNANTYWSYPISANNREWSAISGDWLSGGNNPLFPNTGGRYQQYGSAISTGHILWDTQAYLGGIVGGQFGSISYVGYTENIPAVVDPIIMNGKVYINLPTAQKLFECFDLTTGELLYTATGTVTAGMHLPGNAYAQAISGQGGAETTTVLGTSYGASPIPWLFGTATGANNAAGLPTTVWNYYYPLTGQLMRTITNVTAPLFNFFDGTELAFGQTYLLFNLTTDIYKVNYVYEWNITKVTSNDWYTGLVWKTTINNPAKGIFGPGDGMGRTAMFMSADMSTLVVGASAGDNLAAGFNAQTGAWLWNLTLPFSAQTTPPIYNSNKWMIWNPLGSTMYCYNMLTGTLLWTAPNIGTYPYNTKASGRACNDNNNYYVPLPSGEIVALSLATGNVVWTSKAIVSTESAAGVLSYWSYTVAVGGVLYDYAGYYPGSYEIDPIQRFSVLVATNATTGATLWTLNGGIVPSATANGYLIGYSALNGMDYCLGKGQTSTSVSVQNDVVNEGATVLIKGNVLDQSPAQPGTPAVSDSSISEQMDYLHFQNATLINNPPKEQGVQVTLTAVDPNMNTVTIGTTTTNSAGNFFYNFVPKTTGIYTITATFDGSGSYWPSSSQAGITATSAAASSTSAPATTTSSDVTTPILMAAIAIIIVIIIVGAVLGFLMLRKRP